VGIDPCNGVDDVPQQLPGRRYVAMTDFLEHVGTGGTRMMRLTASLQVSLDPGTTPLRRWRLLNALAPFVVAAFASSPVYLGRETGDRSFRARVWRELDGGRTGLFRCGPDPVGEYLEFALRAPAILLPWQGGQPLPFASHAEAGTASPEDWRTHLSTLFPEVRPRGFHEVRSCDAVAPEWYAAPLVFLAGIAYDPGAAAEAAALLGDPDPELLERAGRLGLRDPYVAAVAAVLCGLALRGAEGLGEGVVPGAVREEAREFFRRYTLCGRCPADDTVPAGGGEATAGGGGAAGGGSTGDGVMRVPMGREVSAGV
jgi:glutamate--cysteine ligase